MPTSTTTPEARARALVAEALKIQGAVAAGDTMSTLAVWDSLGHMNIVLALEGALGRAIRAEDIAMLTSVRAVADILAREESA